MNLEEMSLVDLKALAYDTLVILQQAQDKLNKINAAIQGKNDGKHGTT